MLRRMICDLKYSLSCFPGKKIELFKWIFLRALNETLSPLMVPFIIRFMLDSYEGQSGFLLKSFMLFIVLILSFMLSFYIYVYSDAWVIKTMYDYQSDSLEKLCCLPPCELNDKYSKGDISYVINSGAWGMIQLWMKIFRITGPLIGTIVLLIYSLDCLVVLFFVLLFCILVDVVEALMHIKLNFKFNEKLVQIQGEKDNELRFFLQNIEFLVMNKGAQREMGINNCIVNEHWRVLWQKSVIDASFNLGTDMLETILKGYVFLEVNSNRNELTSGQIGTINQIYTNVRNSANSTRSQITSLPELLVQVEKINELTGRDLLINSNELEWNERSKIVFQNITLSYGDTDIIINLNLEINYGDKIAIIGDNGSGKTTFLKALLRIIAIKKGKICIDNYNISEINERSFRDFFAYLPADLLLFSTLVEENINMSSDKKITEIEFSRIMSQSSFNEEEAGLILRKKTNELSGGQTQRVSFGRMIAKEKPIYLLDEPTSALDKSNAQRIMKHMFSNLTTYVYTTHNADEIIYSNRVIYMESGKVVCDLTREQFLESEYYLTWLGKNATRRNNS